MAATERAPVDEFTGLPLLIAPQCQPLPFEQPEIADPDHAWFPELNPILRTIAGKALRNCQLQQVERWLHNEKHKSRLGPELPNDEVDILGRVVAACAGVMPREVEDFSGIEPVIRPATHQEWDFLHTPSETDNFGYKYVFYRYDPIRIFLKDFAFRQKLDHIRDGLIDEFLCTQDQERKMKLGRFLISNAIAVAADPIRERYAQFRRAELLHPGMPQEVQTLIGYKVQLSDPVKRTRLIDQYETVLAAA